MTRAQWTMAILLVIQLVLLGTVALRSGDAGAGGSHPLLPELQEITPVKLEVSQGTDQSVSLDHRDGGWVLEDPDGYPADDGEMEKLLEKLKGLTVRRPVVTSSRYHKTFKVTEEQYERRLRIWNDAADDPEIELFLGTSPNFNISHVRLGGSDDVYEVRGLNSYDLRAEPAYWVRRKLVDVPVEDVTGLRLRNAHGEIGVEKADGEWRWSSEVGRGRSGPDATKVDTFLRSVCSLSLNEPAGPFDDETHGFDRPAAVLEITRRATGSDGDTAGADEDVSGGETTETESIAVVVGAEVTGDEGRRYAHRSGSEFEVILSEFDASKLVDKKAADLEEKTE
jgi:hypothetical protein